MVWIINLLWFLVGGCVGALFVKAKFSKWRKEYEVSLDQISREAEHKCEQTFIDAQKKLDQQMIAYRNELNKLIMEELLVKAEFPERDQAN